MEPDPGGSGDRDKTGYVRLTQDVASMEPDPGVSGDNLDRRRQSA